MPYASIADVPPSLSSLSLNAATLWSEIYDSRIEAGDRAERAAVVAWAEVRRRRPDEERHDVPKGVREAAQRALDWRARYGAATKGGTATGWKRARQLAREDDVSGSDIVTIAAWWARHAKNAREVSDEYVGTPWKDAGYVSGLLWGGLAGRRWAESLRRRRD